MEEAEPVFEPRGYTMKLRGRNGGLGAGNKGDRFQAEAKAVRYTVRMRQTQVLSLLGELR